MTWDCPDSVRQEVVEAVRQVDDLEQERDAEHADQEDLQELADDVSVEDLHPPALLAWKKPAIPTSPNRMFGLHMASAGERNWRSASFSPADESHVVQTEHAQTHAHHQADAALAESHGDGHADQHEDDAGGGNGELLPDLDLEAVRPLTVPLELDRVGPERVVGGGRHLEPPAGLPRLGHDARGVRRSELYRRGRQAPETPGRGGHGHGEAHLLHLRGRHLGLAHLHEHRVDRQLAVAAEVAQIAVELVADLGNPDVVLLEPHLAKHRRRLVPGFLDLAVEQGEVQVGLPVVERHEPAVGVDRARPVDVPLVPDRDVVQPARGVVDVGRLDEQPAWDHLVHATRLQGERRLLSRDADTKAGQLVVGLGEHRVVEPHHSAGHQRRGQHDGRRDTGQADPAGLHGRDLVVRGQPVERVQDGHQDRHGDDHRHDERDRVEEHLGDHLRPEALADQPVELPGQLIEQHEQRQRRQREGERRDMLLEYVSAEDPHGLGSVTCALPEIGFVVMYRRTGIRLHTKEPVQVMGCGRARGLTRVQRRNDDES